MTAPSAPIDSDLVEGSKDTLYVIENGSIWKTSNLSEAGAATWTEVWIEGALLQGTLGGLLRVRCAPGSLTLVYVLGWGEKDGTYYPFVLRSNTAGMTWSEHWIDEEIDIGAGSFTVGSMTSQTGNSSITFSGSTNEVVCIVSFDGAEQHQWASREIYLNLPADLRNAELTIEYDVIGDSPSRDYDTDGDNPPYIDYLSLGRYCDLVFTSISGGYHASGTIDVTVMAIKNRLRLGWEATNTGRWGTYAAATRTSMFKNLVIDGVEYKSAMPKALDVARSNTNWIYVGLQDKIMKSEDGGYTWAALTEVYGAYDICVDPQAAGAIYFADPNGSIRLMVAGVDQGQLTNETATDVPLRIARDINSGKLWCLESGTKLTRRENGAWTDQKIGLLNARGLHAYIGGKLIFVDISDIYVSNDYGATVAAKKGGWSEFEAGVNAHRVMD